jgi:hypothetical protein
MIADYPWGRSYKSAILETDRSRLAERIQAAERAIMARLQDLNNDHGGTSEEQTAIRDALSGLRMLQTELSQSVPESRVGGRTGGDASQPQPQRQSGMEQE